MARPRLPVDPVVAVVGATGLVGEVLLDVLEQRSFPMSELLLLASARSAGQAVRFRGKSIEVAEARPEALAGADLVFFAATGALSSTLAPEALRHGAFVVDKSSTFRLEPEVPLVVPEVNASALGSERLVACPNCTTIGLVMALEPLRRIAPLLEVEVTSLQAAGGAGRPGLEELSRQERELQAGEPLRAESFARPLARNVVPLCEELEDDGSSTEERKLVTETRRILGTPSLSVRATCVRVPVPVGHALSVSVRAERELDVDEARAAFAAFDGIELRDLPTPQEAAGADEVLVGRVRRPLSGEGLSFFVVADNLRKGAALNAVQIAELVA